MTDKTHPLREIDIGGVRLIGHQKVQMTFYYETESKGKTTCHTQVVEFSLCEARYLGRSLHRVADALRAQLDDFVSAISGGRT